MEENRAIEEHPNYYSILTAAVRYDKSLKPMEKIMYSEITALSNKNGVCTASNTYFANLYGTSVETISRWINNLKKKGYISIEYQYLKETKSIEKRLISITNLPIDEKINTYCLKSQEGIDKKVKDNNTSINNIKEIYKENNFKKPTLDEVKNYCIERNNDIDYQKWLDYYTANGWKVGKNPMKDWKAAVRTWERNHDNKSKESEVTYGVHLN